MSFASEADIDEFANVLGQFERGEITPEQWRVFRLVRGTYGQRQVDDAQMIRVKIPQGVLTVEQLHALADVAEQYSRGFGHITTRQNVQFHFVQAARRRAGDAAAGRRRADDPEACGNSVRNITACQFAGVAADEPFDVTPYAEALTRFLLRHPLSSSLPRKFKIAFEGCAHDHIKLTINDIGWRARVENGTRGFRVYIGGGTATMTTAATVLFEFLPVEEMLNVAEAVLRVFHARGDYQHKQRNRMKFLIKSIGWEAFRRAAFDDAQLARRCAAEGGRPLEFDVDAGRRRARAIVAARQQPPALDEIVQSRRGRGAEGTGHHSGSHRGAATTPQSTALRARWARTNVRPQKQPDYVDRHRHRAARRSQRRAISRHRRPVAGVRRRLGARHARCRTSCFAGCRDDDLPALYEASSQRGLGLPDADTIADVTSCPGAESCKLAVTQSRGLGQAVEQHLRDTPALIEMARDLDIKVSGCPNGCGQHHIAAIGFQGSLRKIDGKAVPQYFIQIGGGIDAERTTFGRLAAKVPARRAPLALERLVRLYAAEKQDGETALAFFRASRPRA